MKSYYLTSFWKHYSILSISIPFWAIIAVIAYQGIYFDFVIPVSILGLILTALGIYNVQTSHIVVSQAGIEWHILGTVSWAKWNNVEKISHRLYGFYISEGIYFDKLFFRINQIHIGYFPNPFTQPPIKPFLPLSYFADNWRDSELAQQIKQYAPRLFEKENKQSV